MKRSFVKEDSLRLFPRCVCAEAREVWPGYLDSECGGIAKVEKEAA
jgi:hypothetical protein